MTTTNENATKTYGARRTEIDGLLESIRTGLKDHAMGFDGRNWGSVGDLGSIATNLRDLSDRLHGTGEYAD